MAGNAFGEDLLFFCESTHKTRKVYRLLWPGRKMFDSQADAQPAPGILSRFDRGIALANIGPDRPPRPRSARPVPLLSKKVDARPGRICSTPRRPCTPRPGMPPLRRPGCITAGVPAEIRHWQGTPGRRPADRRRNPQPAAAGYLTVAAARAWIISCEKSPPRLTPGQRIAALAQLSQLAMLPGQKGQVRHWLGRRL